MRDLFGPLADVLAPAAGSESGLSGCGGLRDPEALGQDHVWDLSGEREECGVPGRVRLDSSVDELATDRLGDQGSPWDASGDETLWGSVLGERPGAA